MAPSLRARYLSLRAKYRALCATHRALLDRDAARGGRARREAVLALAAMRARGTALAVLCGGRFLVRNDAWLRLATARRGSWRAVSAGERPAGGRTWPNLDALVLERAPGVAARGGVGWSGLLGRGAGDAFAEVRLERAHVVEGAPFVLAMIVDVTGRVRQEEAVARRLEALGEQARLRAVGELASGIAHDLNNTLHALRLRLSRLDAAPLAPLEADSLHAAERIADEAGERVRRLQDLSGRRMSPPVGRVGLREVVDHAVEQVRPELARGGSGGAPVSLVDRTGDLPAVSGDLAELRQVLVGLLLNARDAMHHGGTITLTARVEGDGSVELSVEDEGTGVAPEHLARVFDPFFTTKGTRRGVGLGLSIAANVMRRLGGSLRARNRRGGGAVFTLGFPPPRAPAPAPEVPSAPGAAPVPRRVLVVDDDVDNLDAMRLVVEQLGHHVEIADSGTDAIARVEAGERYDVVLCDLRLGDTSGWDVADALHDRAATTRFYLVTGWAEEISPDDPRGRHVLRVLPKPLGVDELERVLADAPSPMAPPGAPAPRPARDPSGDGRSTPAPP